MSTHTDFNKRFRRQERGIKAGFGLILVIQIIVFVLVIIGVSILVSRCNRNLEENGTTFIEQMGKDIREVKDEFNKGFNADTLVVDTLTVE